MSLNNKKLIIFDLDGTILDTIADIAAAVNRALIAFGYPTHSVSDIQSFLGNGSLMLMKRALGGDADEELCKRVRERFRVEYDSGMYDLTFPYEGMSELLSELKSRGAVLCVISNKDDKNAVPMVEHYFGGIFTATRGVRGDTDRKPNPELTLNLVESLGFTPDEALFVGDGMPDFNVSKNAKIDFVPVGYGYTPSEKLFDACGIAPVKDVSELREKLFQYFT